MLKETILSACGMLTYDETLNVTHTDAQIYVLHTHTHTTHRARAQFRRNSFLKFVYFAVVMDKGLFESTSSLPSTTSAIVESSSMNGLYIGLGVLIGILTLIVAIFLYRKFKLGVSVSECVTQVLLVLIRNADFASLVFSPYEQPACARALR
jgi:hypothetical protein